jgi:Protein of unknown function (DUF3800)
MYLCYIDESGTSDIPGNTSHFVLAGLSIPIWHWKTSDRDISDVLSHYGLCGKELHTAWLLRSYLEQSRIPGFSQLTYDSRRAAVEQARTRELLRLQANPRTRKAYQQQKKTFAHTSDYIHLTRQERLDLIRKVADKVATWGYARLFAECVDKNFFDPSKSKNTIGEQAFEQVISRFEKYLDNINEGPPNQVFGLLVHDNNETVAKKHTDLMRRFHQQGTLWTSIARIVETPLFVDSRLTSMVQVADLCAYALRRYFENHESDLFNRIYPRADRVVGKVVGIRHYTLPTCPCDVCQTHK